MNFFRVVLGDQSTEAGGIHEDMDVRGAPQGIPWRVVYFEPVLPVDIVKKRSVGIVIFFVRSGLPHLDACTSYGAASGCGADSSSQNVAGTNFYDSGSLNFKAN